MIMKLEEEESSSEKEKMKKITKKSALLLGKGHFGKEYKVNDGMEEEATALRRE